MCNCRSYNLPKEGQKTKEVIMKPPFMDKTICVDACIAADIQSLWDAGFITLGCCCGHNKEPANVVVERSDADKLRMFIDKNFSRKWKVLAWELVGF